MQILYQITIIFIGVLLYVYRPKWIVAYWLLMFPLFFPIVNIGLMIFDREIFRAMMHTTYIAFRNLFLILACIELCKRKFHLPPLGDIYKAILLVAVYMLLHGLIHHPFSNEVWPKSSEVISLILPLMFFVMRRDLCPKKGELVKIIGFILVLQAIGLAINIFGYHIYPTFYIPYVMVMENGMSYDDEALEGMMRGTFPSSTVFANFLVVVYMFFAVEYFSNKRISNWKFYVLTAFIGTMCFVSGIRVSAVLFVGVFIAANLLYVKQHLKSFVVTTTMIVGGVILLLSIDLPSVKDLTEYESVNRQIEGLASFTQSQRDNDDDHSTFRLTTYLIENYLLDGFLIGNGKAYKGEFAYGNSGNVTLVNFVNDARLAFVIVEYGIFGLMVYYYFFNSIFKFLKKRVPRRDRKKLGLCFLFYILLTIVDPGLFDRLNFPLVYLYTFSVLSSPP